mmetsp:Transcript_55976/g.92980  ORF Transcript_55976/g.92980 Transcript_55976/m.92980 type:complete len:248 (+) Transcript_55976:179-922(+)|eukprot:CAMPEP_0174304026 /NCGR_PEP_ID=MMETSP0809-20121228/60536_1 /TAXON_ID=73025 ORGANISM="Eutreptiella gymnastica-like, Strain CCMP1594" /NCGR_SAMPLE_ID=MMETSP0809 /ASSEMBLY_ACC=CAM_ASM_000658 /LENGTH=247 /DNA_ID=CAMNT_0015410163 /DNA_START=1036 /DNA_END=1779 /DNA_ORIENTATION=-
MYPSLQHHASKHAWQNCPFFTIEDNFSNCLGVQADGLELFSVRGRARLKFRVQLHKLVQDSDGIPTADIHRMRWQIRDRLRHPKPPNDLAPDGKARFVLLRARAVQGGVVLQVDEEFAGGRVRVGTASHRDKPLLVGQLVFKGDGPIRARSLNSVNVMQPALEHEARLSTVQSCSIVKCVLHKASHHSAVLRSSVFEQLHPNVTILGAEHHTILFCKACARQCQGNQQYSPSTTKCAEYTSHHPPFR